MTQLGDFTPATSDDEPAEMTFTYFGHEMRLHPEFGELVFTDWVEEFGSLDERDPRTITATKALMQRVVHPDDFAVFWATARGHKQGSADLSTFFNAILSAVTDRPTGQRSDSSRGQARTLPSSVGDSYSRAIGQFENEGRPDLALVVTRAQEARTA